MRVLLSGLIGAAAGAAAWFFIEYATGREFGWLAIAVGLITGMCINAAAGAGSAASYGRGALAVVLTMIAMVGGRAVYAKVMQNITSVSTIAPAAEVAKADPDQDPQGGAGGEAQEENADAEQAFPDRSGLPTAGIRLQRPTVNSMSELDMLWMGLAALVAYFTGKGSGKAGPVVVEETPDGTAPA